MIVGKSILQSLRAVAPDELWGGSEILYDEPRCTTYEDAFFVPQYWTLFDKDGFLIQESAFRRHGGSEAPGSAPHVEVNAQEFEYISDPVVFGGTLHGHYGHFICTSLSRMWAFDRFPQHRIFFSGLPFSQAAATQIGHLVFSKFKVDAARAMQSPGAIGFRRIIVPESSFDEQWRAFSIYRDMCMMVGKGQQASETRPAYLSKTRLDSGVNRFQNEIEIETELSREGIEIIYPEQLSIENQIALFSSPRTLMGMGGSAFHTHIFSPANGKIINVQARLPMISNQVLLDKLAARQVEHYVPTQDCINDVPHSGFAHTMSLVAPQQIARDLLELI